MGTYACYNIWAGVTSKEIEDALDSHPDIEKHQIFKKLNSEVWINITKNNDGCNELWLKRIYMHGTEIGIGIEVQDLDWNNELDETNVYNPDLFRESALKILNDLNTFFQQEGIPLVAKLYHYIDLGG